MTTATKNASVSLPLVEMVGIPRFRNSEGMYITTSRLSKTKDDDGDGGGDIYSRQINK